ncbi:hypothetical protein M422DRAFT_266885 [Sphaerobolus stellatus SS14]|uniref:Protein-S-isoprenylcysteine O-methyltransferase n=1 Tax=Sphaerobolus stellatus (strain SS14) TaxID=990650 RepID=A0A0C9V1C4_SPHS4|nr:hypothetical protein M422DRAFT_266885 [Sphaerobolus stellatus SS14]
MNLLKKSTKDDDLELNATFFDKHVEIFVQLARLPFFLRVLAECLVIMAVAFPTSLVAQQAPLTRMAFVGFGGGLRIVCFRTLGKFFTFKITIRPEYKIMDIGPYGVVRHPAYTGSLFLLSVQ